MGVIPLKVTPRHVLLIIFLSFYRPRVLNPLQGALCDVFCSKLCLIHHTRLICRHETTIFLPKSSSSTGQRVVSQPPRPIARMAPECLIEYPASMFTPLCWSQQGLIYMTARIILHIKPHFITLNSLKMIILRPFYSPSDMILTLTCQKIQRQSKTESYSSNPSHSLW